MVLGETVGEEMVLVWVYEEMVPLNNIVMVLC